MCLQVLVIGGQTSDGQPSASIEVFNPATGAFSPGAPSNLFSPRYLHTTTLLASGQVLVVGGVTTGGVATGTCELYDVGTGQVTATAPLNIWRREHSATLLSTGQVRCQLEHVSRASAAMLPCGLPVHSYCAGVSLLA